MAYTETTSTSYGKRLGDSLKGIITGFVLFIVGTVVLFWNEGNFVKTKKAINEGQSVVVPVSDVNSVNPELNGKFIHASALADTRDTLTDDLFGVKGRILPVGRKIEDRNQGQNRWWTGAENDLHLPAGMDQQPGQLQ